MGMRATVKQYSIIVRTREKKAKGRTKLEQEQIWNGFQGFRRNIHPSRSGRIDLPWRWRLVKDIIIKKALIMRAMNSLMLIWKAGSSGDADRHLVRHLKTDLGGLHCRSRGKQRNPKAMFQAYD